MIGVLLAGALAVTAPTERFALIVTYNGGPELARPPLHYADDDGAKYFEVFAALDKPENVELLTEFDDDSARLFPALSKLAKLPTLAEVQAAAGSLRERVQASRQRGNATELTFVFAGHGDVSGGKGFVSLKRSPLDGDGLTALLQTVGADRSHVILDSCNSFFVLSPRGHGRRFATPADISDRLARQMPNVGVFLSTNAEAEVFEWSELQSGVFSHAVRSGLLGAADANGDGVVSYEELAAFVDTATKDVKNPLFRPKVFARGPGGDDSLGLANPSQGSTVPLTIDDPRDLRLCVRDGQGLRWIDAHKEAGARLVLRLPRLIAAEGSVERITTDGRSMRARLLLADPGGAPLELSRLGAGGPYLSARGDTQLLVDLWDSPFGPDAVTKWEHDRAAGPPPVFGIDTNEQIRMRLLLTEIGQTGRDARLQRVFAAVTMAGALTAYAGLLTQVNPGGSFAPSSETLYVMGAGVAGLTTVSLVLGVVALVQESDEEKVLARFNADLADPKGDPAQVVASTTEALERTAERDRKRRTATVIGACAVAGLGGALLAGALTAPTSALSPTDRQMYAWVGGGVAATGLASIGIAALSRTPSERLVELWRQDPDRVQIDTIGMAPTRDGKGAALVLGGRF